MARNLCKRSVRGFVEHIFKLFLGVSVRPCSIVTMFYQRHHLAAVQTS
jgi:hypothetical protein